MRSHRLTIFAAIAVAGVYAYAHPPSTFAPHDQGRDRATKAAAGGSKDPPKYPASLADADDTTDRESNPLSPGTIVTLPSGGAAGAEIEVVTRGDVRRAKLYYLRDLRGKAAKIKEKRETPSAS